MGLFHVNELSKYNLAIQAGGISVIAIPESGGVDFVEVPLCNMRFTPVQALPKFPQEHRNPLRPTQADLHAEVERNLRLLSDAMNDWHNNMTGGGEYRDYYFGDSEC